MATWANMTLIQTVPTPHSIRTIHQLYFNNKMLDATAQSLTNMALNLQKHAVNIVKLNDFSGRIALSKCPLVKIADCQFHSTIEIIAHNERPPSRLLNFRATEGDRNEG